MTKYLTKATQEAGFLAYSWKAERQECKAAGYTVHSQDEEEKGAPCAPFYSDQTPVPGMVLPIFKVGLPLHLNSLELSLQRGPELCFLNPGKLTMRANHHTLLNLERFLFLFFKLARLSDGSLERKGNQTRAAGWQLGKKGTPTPAYRGFCIQVVTLPFKTMYIFIFKI